MKSAHSLLKFNAALSFILTRSNMLNLTKEIATSVMFYFSGIKKESELVQWTLVMQHTSSHKQIAESTFGNLQ